MSTIVAPHPHEPVAGTPRRSMTRARMNRIFERDGMRCRTCGADLWMADRQFDHVLPLELGGQDHDDNLQLLCIPCHKAKTREDIKRIRKAQRLERDHSPETRRRSPRPIRSRGFAKDPLR